MVHPTVARFSLDKNALLASLEIVSMELMLSCSIQFTISRKGDKDVGVATAFRADPSQYRKGLLKLSRCGGGSFPHFSAGENFHPENLTLFISQER
jgi:hypothetical protein